MDEFIDKLKDGAIKAKDGAGRIAKEVAKRTSNAITHTKLSFLVNDTRGKIKDICSSIGQAAYEKYLEGDAVDGEFTSQFEQLDALMEELDALNEKIAELQNSQSCKVCGAKNNNDAEYCSKCGAKLERIDGQPEEAEEEDDTSFNEDSDEDVIVIDPKKPE